MTWGRHIPLRLGDLFLFAPKVLFMICLWSDLLFLGLCGSCAAVTGNSASSTRAKRTYAEAAACRHGLVGLGQRASGKAGRAQVHAGWHAGPERKAGHALHFGERSLL